MRFDLPEGALDVEIAGLVVAGWTFGTRPDCATTSGSWP